MKHYKITAYDKGCIQYKEGAYVDYGLKIMYANSITLLFKYLLVMFFDEVEVKEVVE
jgi:hypothetical protein